jgi:uncharacterized protein (TIGR02284 family)
METSEKSVDVINDLIKINNDRSAGFEKAAQDLEDGNSELITVFNRLAGESREYANELTGIARQYYGDVAEGTSTSGDLHRAWISIKSTFTGNDAAAILDECERGEDAAKSAYSDALDDSNELTFEVSAVLQRQQEGIIAGHDLIKSLRVQAERAEERETANEDNSARLNQPEGDRLYQGNSGQFQSEKMFSPEPESIEQEQEWQQELDSKQGNSKLMEFFINELKDLLWAERELVDTLPDMAEAATSAELKSAFQLHLEETQEHVSRLEQVFGLLGLEPESRKCDAMAGIIDEGDEIISATEEGTAQRDVGLIFAGQKAEHYEIASYGGMIALAKTLGYLDIAELFVMTLDEEKTADGKLTEIAEGQANYAASNERTEE